MGIMMERMIIMIIFFDSQGGVRFDGLVLLRGVHDKELFDDLKIVSIDFVGKYLLIAIFLKHQKIKL